MNRAWYIWHRDTQNFENGEAYFGPFSADEIDERVNDAYADLLAGCGEVDALVLTDKQADAMYVNPREYWMTQLAKIEEV
jgi:hypothetical protein